MTRFDLSPSLGPVSIRAAHNSRLRQSPSGKEDRFPAKIPELALNGPNWPD